MYKLLDLETSETSFYESETFLEILGVTLENFKNRWRLKTSKGLVFKNKWYVCKVKVHK